jgi:hypothetical protein
MPSAKFPVFDLSQSVSIDNGQYSSKMFFLPEGLLLHTAHVRLKITNAGKFFWQGTRPVRNSLDFP